MRPRAFRFVVLLVALLAGCTETTGFAVVNETDEAYYLRYEGQWVWEVPPRTSGIGPTQVEPGGK